MTEYSEALLRRIRKTLELAKRGEGGEKDTAERMLEALLKQAGLTIDDIDGEHLEVTQAKFNCKTFYEKALLHQVVSMVTNNKEASSFSYKTARTKARQETTMYELNKSQEIEVNLHYDILRVALNATMLESLSAFIVANNIFAEGPSKRKSDADLSPEELLRRRRIELMALIMPKTAVHKAIAQ